MKNLFRELRIRVFIVGLCLLSYNVILIGQQTKREQLEAQKVAFITKHLELTVDEAQKFWPVYNEYQQKKEEILKERRLLLLKINQRADNFSESELTKLSDSYVNLEMEEAKLLSSFHEKFKSVLPIRKVILYYQSEERYKLFLLRQLGDKKRQSGQ